MANGQRSLCEGGYSLLLGRAASASQSDDAGVHVGAAVPSARGIASAFGRTLTSSLSAANGMPSVLDRAFKGEI